MLKKYRADLHIHSCLSPCAELDMTPVRIVGRATGIGLDIIAVSDHNSAEHTEITQEIARKHLLTVLPAMEITTSEEVHILALFETVEDCGVVQDEVYNAISTNPSYRHDETSQPVINDKEEILFFNRLPLINATSIPLTALIELVHKNHGIAIASHIDREYFGIISQLGFIPDGLPLDAVEVSFRVRSYQEAVNIIPHQNYPVVSFSDSHHLRDIGRRITEFSMEAPTVEEIARCLRGEDERRVRVVY